MERVCDLLFELSNEDRINILFELKKKPMKLSHVSKKLEFTVQETSRNINRLVNANLIERKADGAYILTHYGLQALEMLKGYEFLANNSEYLIGHTLSRLPYEFSAQVGTLVGTRRTDDVLLTFFEFEKMIQASEEDLMLSTDQHYMSALPHIADAIKRGVQVKSLFPKSIKFPTGYFEQESVKEWWPVYLAAVKSGQYQERFIEELDAVICVTEKSARVYFPDVNGEYDYDGFVTEKSDGIRFVRDVFMHYWETASPRMPDPLIEQMPEDWQKT
jgi:predicted transcriptional regulator